MTEKVQRRVTKTDCYGNCTKTNTNLGEDGKRNYEQTGGTCRLRIFSDFKPANNSNLSYYTPCITPKRVTSFTRPISASLRRRNTAPSFQTNVATVRAVGNAVFHLTGQRFEPQTSRSGEECVTARPPGWFSNN